MSSWQAKSILTTYYLNNYHEVITQQAWATPESDNHFIYGTQNEGSILHHWALDSWHHATFQSQVPMTYVNTSSYILQFCAPNSSKKEKKKPKKQNNQIA